MRLLGHIRAGGNRPEEGVPRLGGRLLWADWALDLFPVVAVTTIIYRGSYMSAHVLLNLLNELGKSDKMRGLPRHVISNNVAF